MQRSPFKFLDYYHKEDKDIFFGRDYETLELYERTFETSLVLLYGASGTGKTSIINCGLENQFAASDWYPISIRREQNLMLSMRKALDKHAVKPLNPEAPLADQVKSLYLDYFKPIFLIFDQFEELFILGEKNEQRTFFREIANLMQANIQCKIILSMREEYIAYLSEYEHTIPSMFDNRLRIEKMNTKLLTEVIEGTTQAFEIEIDTPEVVIEKIIERLRDKNQEVDLANLQVFLDRLYRLDDDSRNKEENPNRKICFDQALISQIGTFEDVMGIFLDEQLDILDAELAAKGIQQKNIPIDILFELVTDTGTKQSLEVEHIKMRLKNSKKIDGELVDYCVQRFKQMRLIRDFS